MNQLIEGPVWRRGRFGLPRLEFKTRFGATTSVWPSFTYWLRVKAIAVWRYGRWRQRLAQWRQR